MIIRTTPSARGALHEKLRGRGARIPRRPSGGVGRGRHGDGGGPGRAGRRPGGAGHCRPTPSCRAPQSKKTATSPTSGTSTRRKPDDQDGRARRRRATSPTTTTKLTSPSLHQPGGGGGPGLPGPVRGHLPVGHARVDRLARPRRGRGRRGDRLRASSRAPTSWPAAFVDFTPRRHRDGAGRRLRARHPRREPDCEHGSRLERASIWGSRWAPRLIGLKVLDGTGAGKHEPRSCRRSIRGGQPRQIGHRHHQPVAGASDLRASRHRPAGAGGGAAVQAGIVVVVSAGNYGGNPTTGWSASGASPRRATPPPPFPSALDTRARQSLTDDVIAPYSSRGPTWYDGFAKPDLVAPGHKLPRRCGDPPAPCPRRPRGDGGGGQLEHRLFRP